MLMGLGLPLPHNLLAHGFITVNGEKMSKSIGNVVDPQEILAKHGLTPFRYYFLRHASTTDDSDFTWDKYEASYNELANDLGNLVQRLATLCGKNSVRVTRSDTAPSWADDFTKRMDAYEFNVAFDILWDQIQSINKDLEENKPWSLAKTDPEKAKDVLSREVDWLLGICEYLAIFLPETATKIKDIFEADEIKAPATPLFPKN
jgi:methionyl-tRNA synthetase